MRSEETQVRRISYAIRASMLVAKRHFVTRRDILAMAITLTEARGADLRPNDPVRVVPAKAGTHTPCHLVLAWS